MSVFGQLAASLHWKGSDVVSVVTLTAHFDESGHPRDPRIMSFSIGGSVATCDEWITFDRAWIRALGRVPWLHMADFEAAKHPARRHERQPNPYRGWKTIRRHAFLKRLLDVVEQHSIFHVGSSQSLPAVSERHAVDVYYTYHYRFCLQRAALCAEQFTTDDKVLNFVFAKQELTDTPEKLEAFTDYYRMVTKLFSEINWRGRVGSIVVDDPRRIPALQVADLVAYESGKEHGRLQQSQQCTRYPFERIRARLSHFNL